MTVSIRDFQAQEDYEACADLQREVWGFTDRNVVPPIHLAAMHHYGGVLVGAFDADRMVGFVCGFTGWERGRIFHHSHMLAVISSYRGRRLGERLKWAQRERVLAQGIELVNWTFDPLQALNAHLNLNRLGALVRRYKVNVYGESESPLHGGIPTDRFEAEWHLKSPRVLQTLEGARPQLSGWEQLPRANRTETTSSGLLRCGDELEMNLSAEALLVEVPGAITDVMSEDRELALDWRKKTRTLFRHYLAEGYSAVALHRAGGSAFYRLER